ncbi:MAG: precorrin-2 dehydrogenase/sirohydrochlorin ferrochelatase family protein [Caulobacteraceae bacterium]
MIPVLLDPQWAQLAVIGRDTIALRRVLWLRQGGASPDVWSDGSSAALREASGGRFNEGLPSEEELSRYHAVWIAGLAHDEARRLCEAARASGVLVNVEDDLPLCDFHTPAVVRRGKLTLAAGTGGASPAAARAVRERLEDVFPETWGEALDEIAKARLRLRAQGENGDVLARDARARLNRRELI